MVILAVLGQWEENSCTLLYAFHITFSYLPETIRCPLFKAISL